MYYVYILKWKRYYCWCTNDIKRRLQEHKRGKTRTTKISKTYDLIWYYIIETQEKALELERKIKDSGHIERWIKNKEFIVI